MLNHPHLTGRLAVAVEGVIYMMKMTKMIAEYVLHVGGRGQGGGETRQVARQFCIAGELVR